MIVALNEPFHFLGSDTFGAHKAFAACAKHSRVQLAGRLIDGMTADFGVRIISCAQLAVLVLLLPFKALKKDSFTTFRVELIVRLYSNLCDKFNFDRVLRLLLPFEYALILYRLGALTIFSVLRPQGNYVLSLSNPEERLLGRVLLQMQKLALNPTLESDDPPVIEKTGKDKEKDKEKEEKLPGLWTDIAYQNQEDRASRTLVLTVPGSEWEMPPEWECDAGFPTSGVLKFAYLPGPQVKAVSTLDVEKYSTCGNRIAVSSDLIKLPEVEIKEKK